MHYYESACTVQIMLSSKHILDITKISRATLNNYIKYGMLSKPIVSKPDLVSTGPRQLGYFPDDTIARIHAISKLKQEGYSMSEIATRLDATAEAAPAFAPVSGSMPSQKSKCVG